MVRDPVHGDVYLTHEEFAVLDAREMQRLRGIKQLGTAHLVFPGAVHTRFEHSIGTCFAAQQMIDAINLSAELSPRECLGIGEEEARVIRMAALVHDVTHIPYGHNVEDQAGLMHRHDSAWRFRERLSPDTEVGRVLDGLGLRRDVLAALLPEVDREAGEPRPVPAYWSQIVSDTICCDLLDYLARDAYFTGLRFHVDPRIASYFRIDRASGNLYIDLAKRSLLREDILSEVVRLLAARYYFSERVYYHHAKVAAGALVARAVELALEGEILTEADLHDATEGTLLDLLERGAAGAPPEVGEGIRSAVERLRGRRLPKRACVFPLYDNAEVQSSLVERYFARERHAERRAAESRIAAAVRSATGRHVDVLVVCPAARMQLKEAHTHVRWPGEGAIRPLSAFADRVPRLADLERSYRGLWKFYVFADASDAALLRKVQDVAEAEFEGAKNAYEVEG